MAESETKRQRHRRLAHAISISGQTVSALRDVLATLQADTISRRQLLAGYHTRFNEVARVDRLPCTDGTFVNWEYADPFALLRLTLEESPAFQQVFIDALRKYPNSPTNPWHVVAAFDEFIPGNKKVYNARKTMDFMYSFAELGEDALCLTAFWIMPVCVRSSILKAVEGQWSSVLAITLRKLFMGPEDLQTSGVVVTLNGRSHLIYAKLNWLLSDGDGIRMAYCWKGGSGMRPCMVHRNVLKKGAAILASLPDHVDICCGDVTRFQPLESRHCVEGAELVREAHRRWRLGDITKALYVEIEMSEGFTFSALGLPWDSELLRCVDVYSALTMDWMHSALQDGTMTVEVSLCLSRLKAIGVECRTVEDFLLRPDWKFSKTKRDRCKYLHRLFNKWRTRGHDEDEDPHIRCSASELLSLYGLLRNFMQTEIGDRVDMRPELDSFYACCRVIDCFVQAKRRGINMRQAGVELGFCLQAHMRLHKAAYGVDHIKPKHHWLFDCLARIIKDMDWQIFDAFVLERMHLTAKGVADLQDNTSRYERSVLAGVLNVQCRLLQGVASASLLDVHVAPLPGYPDALVSDNMQVRGEHFSVGDLIRCGGNRAGEVLACVKEHDAFYVIVNELSLIEALTPQSSTWRFTGSTMVCSAAHITQTLAWRRATNLVYMIES